MSGNSSAWHISYDIRPGKQIERRIVLESLQASKAASVRVEGLPFIGMGGFRFVDFLLANGILGIRDFTSLEHDDALVRRCEFNKPFEAMRVYHGASADYVASVGFPSSAIIWFDYERGVSSDLKEDMLLLAEAVKPGSFLFITATAELPASLKKISKTEARLKSLQEDLDPLGSKLTTEDMTPKTFHIPAAQVLLGALRLGFAGRGDGSFYPYIRLVYKDTTWMMTVGGFFGSPDEVIKVRSSIKDRCGFLKPDSESFIYQVEQFNITDTERRLLDRMAISSPGRRSEKAQLKKLGIRPSIIDQYPDLMRFIPRYYESLI